VQNVNIRDINTRILMGDLYIGVMSGTSLDGVDISLCEYKKRFKLRYFETFSFDKQLREDILKAIKGVVTLKEIGKLDNELGKMYATQLKQFLQKYHLKPSHIKAIGLHGQTLWHEPNSGFSIQLGNPNQVAAATSIPVVCDIRRMDMASGGQGAPFAPLFHKLLFGHLGNKTAVVNIGGMANISILDDKLIGYDTGCGNVLIDGWCERYFGVNYDENGNIARGGKVDTRLLEVMLDDSYFKQHYPKSTGREYFNFSWLEEKFAIANVEFGDGKDRHVSRDILRTLTELTAITIVNEAMKFEVETIVVCGGGANNTFLIERIEQLFPYRAKVASDFGIAQEAIESMMMGYFAYLRLSNKKAKLKSITGAKKNLIAGGLYESN